MREPLFVISVRDCRATVSKRVDYADGTWAYEPARNWQDLEQDAIEAVETQGGAVNMSALYECPLWLVEKADFERI